MTRKAAQDDDRYRPSRAGPHALTVRVVALGVACLGMVGAAVLSLHLGVSRGIPLAFLGTALAAGGALLAQAFGLARARARLENELEEARRTADREIQQLSAGLAEWVWECDVTGAFTFCGPGVTSVLGFGPEVIRGSRIADLVEVENATRVGSAQDRALRLEEAFRQLDAWCLTRQGERVCVRFGGAPLFTEEGALRGFRGVARDVTAEKKAQQELLEARAFLEAARAESKQLAGRAGAANRTQSDFVARMSHELRTPLHGMIGLTEELDESTLSEAQRGCVDALRESSRRLTRVLGDLLELAKLEAGQALVEVAPFELPRCVRETVEERRAEAEGKGLSLSVDIDPSLPELVRGDATRVMRIVDHVVGNAVKFTDEGRVEARLSSLEGEDDMLRVLFAVRDTGPGIPLELQKKILEPFNVVDTSASRRKEGTGLGLSLVARLAEAMGGRLGIEGAPGEGTRIWFTLRFGVAERSETDIDGSGGSPERCRVLVVDDNRINARVAAKAVERLGHEAVTALSGADALEELRRDRFDLVLTDVQMPEMDGPGLAQAIRSGEAGQSRIPIVALTAHGTRDDRDRCLGAGMNAYLTKPLDAEALRAAISRLVPSLRRTPVKA